MPPPNQNKPSLICPAQMELRSFSRSLGELQWLLLALVLLYSQAPSAKIANPAALIAAMVVYSLFVLCFRYLNFFANPNRWKLAIETWVMILSASLASWYTGGTASPLIGAYLLILIASALTLGKLLTLLEMLLITTIYLYMAYATHGVAAFSLAMFTELMVRFTPLLLVAYLTTMLASDIHYGKQILAEQSHRDELTGLLNMRGFARVLEQEVGRARRYGHPLALLMVDADNLKAINDGHGHEAGNRLIQIGSRNYSYRTPHLGYPGPLWRGRVHRSAPGYFQGTGRGGGGTDPDCRGQLQHQLQRDSARGHGQHRGGGHRPGAAQPG